MWPSLDAVGARALLPRKRGRVGRAIQLNGRLGPFATVRGALSTFGHRFARNLLAYFVDRCLGTASRGREEHTSHPHPHPHPSESSFVRLHSCTMAVGRTDHPTNKRQSKQVMQILQILLTP